MRNGGNDYDKTFTITQNGSEHVFDSFECAVHALAISNSDLKDCV